MTSNPAEQSSPSLSNQRLPAFKYLDVISVIFTLVLVLSNIASSAKIIDWKLSIGKLPLAFDAGTLFFPSPISLGIFSRKFMGTSAPAG